MSNSPSSTLVRHAIAFYLTNRPVAFCLASPSKRPDLRCTRIDNHGGHCCDETEGESWNHRGQFVGCPAGHVHSDEKGLAQ